MKKESLLDYFKHTDGVKVESQSVIAAEGFRITIYMSTGPQGFFVGDIRTLETLAEYLTATTKDGSKWCVTYESIIALQVRGKDNQETKRAGF